jgi:hypothetical protein
MIFNPWKKIKQEREVFSKRFAEITCLLQSEKNYSNSQEMLMFRLKKDYAKRGKLIDELTKENAGLEKALRRKINDCGHCKTCNEKLADEIYFNENGGIVK